MGFVAQGQRGVSSLPLFPISLDLRSQLSGCNKRKLLQSCSVIPLICRTLVKRYISYELQILNIIHCNNGVAIHNITPQLKYFEKYSDSVRYSAIYHFITMAEMYQCIEHACSCRSHLQCVHCVQCWWLTNPAFCVWGVFCHARLHV